jgi:hypothetical protein
MRSWRCCRWCPRTCVTLVLRPKMWSRGGVLGDRAETAYWASFSSMPCGAYQHQWELTLRVMWALAPRMTMPSSRFSTTWTIMSGSLMAGQTASPCRHHGADTIQSLSCTWMRNFLKRSDIGAKCLVATRRSRCRWRSWRQSPRSGDSRYRFFWEMVRSIWPFSSGHHGMLMWVKRLIL